MRRRTSSDHVHADVLLCDADGNLFPSEPPAFDASVVVTNLFLLSLGVPVVLSSDHLRTTTTGKNFRTTAVDLCLEYGVSVHADLLPPGTRPVEKADPPSGICQRPPLSRETLNAWVEAEAQHVTAHLAEVLQPDPGVRAALESLATTSTLAVVSNSAGARVSACLRATGLDHLLPDDRVFSAETSLVRPAPKPDPAVYRHAAERMGGAGTRVMAIEDSATGVSSAVAAGIPVIGNLAFVPAPERVAWGRQLAEAGAFPIVESWSEVVGILRPAAPASTRGRLPSGQLVGAQRVACRPNGFGVCTP